METSTPFGQNEGGLATPIWPRVVLATLNGHIEKYFRVWLVPKISSNG